MGYWLVCENPRQDGFREFELVYQEQHIQVAKKFMRLHDDGRIEVGVSNKPFILEWSRQVRQDEIDPSKRVSLIRERMRGI